MRLDDMDTNIDVEDQGRGGGGGGFGGFGFPMGGGGGIGLGRGGLGCGGIVLLLVASLIFGVNPMALLGGGGGGEVGTTPSAQTQVAQGGSAADAICNASPDKLQSCRVLSSTNKTWSQLIPGYHPPGLSFYEGNGRSGCGAARSAMGPFYCPTDSKVYLDTSFYQELKNRFGVGGDFAQDYVVAHEVGHHVQNLTGVADQVQAAQQRSSKAEGNRYQVAVELQADCYAGVWAAQNRDRMEAGDMAEGLRAAQAIGDDTLQRRAQGVVVPESFTHGTSAQRMEWLQRGLQSGDPKQCDTFAAMGLS
jgi:predicted metalloprotease